MKDNKIENKSQWTIPQNVLIDGSILALKNTDRLIEDSRVAFNHDRYSISLTLSVLALEEFGKHLMLFDYAHSKKQITQSKWKNDFSDHKTKLKSITKTLSKFSRLKNDPTALKANEKLRILLMELLNEKLEGIYLDWNEQKKEWKNYDDLPLDIRKRRSSYVLNVAVRFLNIYIGARGDIPFTTTKEKISLFRARKIHAICDTCAVILLTEVDIRTHGRIFPSHSRLTWYKNN